MALLKTSIYVSLAFLFLSFATFVIKGENNLALAYTREDCVTCLRDCAAQGKDQTTCTGYGTGGCVWYNDSQYQGSACLDFPADQIQEMWTEATTSDPPGPPPTDDPTQPLPQDDTQGCGGGAFCGTDIAAYGRDVLAIGGPLIGGLAVLKIIFGGVMYATAAGNPQRIGDAKSHIYYAIIGLVLILGMNIVLAILGAPIY